MRLLGLGIAVFFAVSCKPRNNNNNLSEVSAIPVDDCMLGATLQTNDTENHSKYGTNVEGQIRFSYDLTKTSIAIEHLPDLKSSMALYTVTDPAARIWGEDWCFSPKEQKVYLLRAPLRTASTYNKKTVQGREVKLGEVIWIAYIRAMPN